MNFQLRYRRFWTCSSHWEALLWFWPQLPAYGNDPLGVIRDTVAAQGKAWKYPHSQGSLARRHFCRAQVEQKYFKAHIWGMVLTRSLPFWGLTTWQAPSWARMGQGGFKTAATAAPVIQSMYIYWHIVNAGLNEIHLKIKDPVPNYLLFGEQRLNNESR